MRALRNALALTLSVATLAGCGPLIEGLENAEQRLIMLEPIKTGTRSTMEWANFGVCHPRLEQRVVGSRSLFVFDSFVPPQDALAGHEVRVARGETCHLREVHRYQAAVQFDLSTLPAGAVTRAELKASTLSHAGTDPPMGFGSSEQCSILALGKATEAWDAGMVRNVLIPAAGLRPAITEFSTQGAFNVTRTVMEWRDERTPNLGFVITPDPEAVTRNAAAVGELREQYMCPVMYRNFRLEVSMLVPRARP